MERRYLPWVLRTTPLLLWSLPALTCRVLIPAPFLYCHSCPLALGLCPVGALQYALVLRRPPLLILGTLLLYGLVLGRCTCGLGCPVGLLDPAPPQTPDCPP